MSPRSLSYSLWRQRSFYTFDLTFFDSTQCQRIFFAVVKANSYIFEIFDVHSWKFLDYDEKIISTQIHVKTSSRKRDDKKMEKDTRFANFVYFELEKRLFIWSAKVF